MPLPFLKPKQISSVIISKRSKDGVATESMPEHAHPEALMKAAEQLISAVHAKDANAVADAIKAIMEHDNASDEE